MLKCCSISTLAILCTSLIEMGYTLQYRLKLSSAVSVYQFPLIVSDMEIISTYSFSPMYPVKDGKCSLVLTGILRSFIREVSHPLFKKQIFCLADSMMNPFRTLIKVSLTLCALQHHFSDINSIPPIPLTLGDISAIPLLSGYC